MEQVKEEFEVKEKGVPLTIIGDYYFSGYSSSVGSLIENKIKEYVERINFLEANNYYSSTKTLETERNKYRQKQLQDLEKAKIKKENENLIYTSKIEHFCTWIPKGTLFIVFSFFA